jgi:hypothetical protein
MRIKPLIFAFVAVLLVVGCKDDDKNEDNFSSLTPEEHKANLETSGLKVADKFNDLEDLEALQVVDEFVELMNATYSSESGVMTVMESVASLEDASGSVFTLKEITIEEQPSLGDSFKEEAGIYTYNSQTQSWDKEESDDQITYKFPVKSSTVNNATISVTNFSYTTASTVYSSTSQDLLKSVNISLKVDETELILFTFSGEYNTDGVPTSLSENLALGKYNISTSLTGSDSKVSFDQAFKYDESNLLSSHFEMRGDLNYGEMISETNPYDQTELEYVNAWVAVDTFKLEGIVDWKSFLNDAGNASNENVASAQEGMEKMAELINNSMSLKLKYNVSDEVIAKGEAYAMQDPDSPEAWILDFRVKFGDGSYMDDSFFSEKNFVDLYKKVGDLMTAMENNYNSIE